ncbi:uncharacterized protein TNCV_1526731 [Trichonephila clavipes]|nr:uncharacterized protein TNCV_1526731 [Trichonephila clavipes]
MKIQIFLNEVLGSGECQFSRQDTINTQNRHYWSLENPHLIRLNRHQVGWSVNVWCGIWKGTLIDSIYFDRPLTSESYTEILSGLLADFLEDEVSLRDLSCMWYQLDGATTHKSVQPCTFLAQTFDTRIISYGGQEVAEATGGVSDAGLYLHCLLDGLPQKSSLSDEDQKLFNVDYHKCVYKYGGKCFKEHGNES